jgi:hypothetical protein
VLCSARIAANGHKTMESRIIHTPTLLAVSAMNQASKPHVRPHPIQRNHSPRVKQMRAMPHLSTDGRYLARISSAGVSTPLQTLQRERDGYRTRESRHGGGRYYHSRRHVRPFPILDPASSFLQDRSISKTTYDRTGIEQNKYAASNSN